MIQKNSYTRIIKMLTKYKSNTWHFSFKSYLIVCVPAMCRVLRLFNANSLRVFFLYSIHSFRLLLSIFWVKKISWTTYTKSTIYLFCNSFALFVFFANRLFSDFPHYIPYFFFFINSPYRLVLYSYSHVCDTALYLVAVVLFKDLDFFLTCTYFRLLHIFNQIVWDK